LCVLWCPSSILLDVFSSCQLLALFRSRLLARYFFKAEAAPWWWFQEHLLIFSSLSHRLPCFSRVWLPRLVLLPLVPVCGPVTTILLKHVPEGVCQEVCLRWFLSLTRLLHSPTGAPCRASFLSFVARFPPEQPVACCPFPSPIFSCISLNAFRRAGICWVRVRSPDCS